MKEESHHPSIAPELEARIAALVLGEASDFERDQLNRLIDQRPELATLKEQIQSVHGLLRDIGACESVAEDDEWKLSADKRNAVLDVISGEAKRQPPKHVANKFVEKQRSAKGNLFWNLTKIAAVFCVAGFFGILAMSSRRFNRAVSSARYRQLGLATHNYYESTDSTHGMNRPSSITGGVSAPSSNLFDMDGAIDVSNGAQWSGADEHDFRAAESTAAELYYEKNSQSALAAIRGTLKAGGGSEESHHAGPLPVELPSPHYLADDVEYFPAGPEFKLPREAAARDAGAWKTLNRKPTAGVNGPGPGQKAANGELSFPRFSGSPVRSTVNVPNGGTVLLGGIKRLQSGGGVPGEVVTGEAGLGSGDRPVAEGEPESSPGFATHDFYAQESGQGQKSSPGQPRKPAGTNLRFPHEPGDSPTAGKEKVFDGIVADGKNFGGGGGGGGFGRTAPAGERNKEISAERKPGRIAQSESDGWLDTAKSNETARSQPMVADRGGIREKEEAEVVSGLDFSGTNGRASSLSSPTNQPLASREDLERDGELAVEESYQDEVAESVTMSIDGDLSFRKSRTRDEGVYSRQIPEPVAGTAIGQPAPSKANQFKRSKTVDGRYADYWMEPGKPPVIFGDTGPADPAVQLRRRDRVAIEGHRYRGYVPPMLEDNSESMKTAPVKKFAAPAGLNEKNAEDAAFSTFSLHVSDVSFKLALAALAQGEWPEPAKIRIEEFVNAFDYGDPMPSESEKVACGVEQSIHPFLQQRNLLRVSMRTAAAGRSSNTPLRLTLLLDNSGSMERIDRQQTVRRAFSLLAQQLKPIDQVTLISFARQPRLLADKVSGAQSQQLVGLIENLPSEGGTNIEAALQLAFEKAKEQQVDNAQNRIILLTDGAVNLGDANPESLSRLITTMRGAGIAFDAAGISAEGLNDEILEALTRQGDGRYYLLDSLEAADDGFARQIAGALRPSAKNVKVQIEFNPKRVGRYKLLGFEKHRLKQEDFRNDQVDAAEMAAAEAGVALYQFEAKPNGEGDVGSVSVRFRDLSTGQMIENCWPIPYEADAPRADQAAPSLRIATSAALLAAKLRGEPLGATVDLKTLSQLISGLPDRVRNHKRVGQLQLMIGQARQVSGQ